VAGLRGELNTVKKILFVTGTRADFGKLQPLIQASIDAKYEVNIFVTGMHMLQEYGLTKKEVSRMINVEVCEFVNHRRGDPQDFILAKTITGLSDYVYELAPDLIISHGDRIEALAASIVAATNYILSAHVEGGEVSGTIDEIFRHCNSKLNTYHFVSSEAAKRRLLKMGENADSIYLIGSPELDIHGSESGVSLEVVKERYDIDFSDYGIVIFHPVTTEISEIGKQAQALFKALVDSQKNFVLIKPNNDPGCEQILAEIVKLPKSRFRILPSMRFHYFSELMKNCSLFIGNSSAGVREAPFLGIPSIDIGSRQHGRSTGQSIHHCSAYDEDLITEFLFDQWGKKYVSQISFGQGSASSTFIKVLQKESFWRINLQKTFIE